MKRTITLLMLIDEMYEDLEAWYPRLRLREENIYVIVAAPEKKTYHGKHGLPIEPDIRIDAVKPDKFDGMIIPGGFAPDLLRRIPTVLRLVRMFEKQKKLIAFICHAGWVLVSAKVIRGRTCTSLPAIKDDMINAGANWKDVPVVIDQNLVSSRRPDDLPQFCRGILSVLNKA